MIITPEDVLNIFDEFRDETPGKIVFAINQANTMALKINEDIYKMSVILLTCHFLTKWTEQEAATALRYAAIAKGESVPSTHVDNKLESTVYGQQYLELREQHVNSGNYLIGV